MIDVPEEFAAAQVKHNGDAGRAFIEQLPVQAQEFTERWELRVTGPAMHGVAALVLPVVRADGSRAALKMQVLDAESEGEPVALRRWDGDGAVRLLAHDEPTNTLLLERLDETRHLSGLDDSREAVRLLAELLARLTAVPAPPGLRTLGDEVRGMQERLPSALARVADPDARAVIADCAAAVREVADEPGDRLLHWDLHYDNVLAGDREPWLAIDPKPLAGDPGFDLMPALANDFALSGVRWRFDLMTGTLGLDRERAAAWTLGRALQNLLWNVADEDPLDEEQLAIARLFLGR
ncbi:Aminoglycoside/hydroxyurea antibiotic resistance kinase [Streptomyces sp. YIM 130001]|uniref:aminoglycoside phosphotransferase family protein n=1 Tax=Streptomyces sp. YIM 130001 TaxID=2259644 RepID=UPI000E65E215|nr:aminoglycoside phosphotransferase family protein [Streptomyces sp. YIM 130001]RII13779.1 Aminoglycoside/hydroxyurea antibiotic resistance kinase [Streptomyces sp. YIM 130001]